MIDIRRSEERGHADHGWLDTYHTFSFGEYYDAEHMRFGPLRVINQDRVEPNRGFGAHDHKDMEIVSYVLNGVMEHKDSMGNCSQMRPGDVQLMSAGAGVTHSEYNASDSEELHFLQMWVIPSELGTTPRYEQKAFPREERDGKMLLVVSPDGAEGSLTIGQDTRLFAGLLEGAQRIEHRIPRDRSGWLHLAKGSLRLNGNQLHSGDGAAIRETEDLVLEGGDAAEFVFWELPGN